MGFSRISPDFGEFPDENPGLEFPRISGMGRLLPESSLESENEWLNVKALVSRILTESSAFSESANKSGLVVFSGLWEVWKIKLSSSGIPWGDSGLWSDGEF